jgi:hypothetical protein
MLTHLKLKIGPYIVNVFRSDCLLSKYICMHEFFYHEIYCKRISKITFMCEFCNLVDSIELRIISFGDNNEDSNLKILQVLS